MNSDCAILTTGIGEFSVGETRWDPNVYRCHLAITKDDDGVVSAVVLNLPGVGSCGDTDDEAVANVREAAAMAIASYRESGQEIPWIDTDKVPVDAKLKWILVNA